MDPNPPPKIPHTDDDVKPRDEPRDLGVEMWKDRSPGDHLKRRRWNGPEGGT